MLPGTVPLATSLASYFNPSKSPFYSVAVIGAVALFLSSDKIPPNEWLYVFIPIWVVLLLTYVLTLRAKPNFLDDDKDATREYDEQVKFARSLSISSALLCLVFAAREVSGLPFKLVYVACLVQIATFLVFAWAYIGGAASLRTRNFVQIALVTSTFLIGATVCSISSDKGPTDPSVQSAPVKQQLRFFVVDNLQSRYWTAAGALYALWVFCELYWLWHLRQYISFSLRPPADKAEPAR